MQCTPLYCAARNGHLQICKLIFEYVEDKNTANNYGFSPLYIAAMKGHFEICKLILENVKDKNPAANDGSTPLRIAAMMGHFDIAKLIVQEETRVYLQEQINHCFDYSPEKKENEL